MLLQQGAATTVGWAWFKPTRLCRMQAPVGAQVASPQSPILRWSKSSEVWFPVSVSRGFYRAGKGNRIQREVELIAAGAMAD